MKSLFLIFAVLLTSHLLQARNPGSKYSSRPLRYHPDSSDFVITNGTHRFNRALYGSNTAFRVEAGDLPEFAMYLPGMGGNLRFGLMNTNGSRWLIDAGNIIARYRPGSMIYTIADPMLGDGNLQVTVLALADAEGMILKFSSNKIPDSTSVFFAFGGVTGKTFSRDGDLGIDPESSFYLKPEYCADNEFTISGNSFTVSYGSGRDMTEAERYENNYKPTKEELEATRLKSKKKLIGVFPSGSLVKISDAGSQVSPNDFYASESTTCPALTGKFVLKSGVDQYLIIAKPDSFQLPEYHLLNDYFDKAELRRKVIADRVQIHTPDPYINTVGSALSVASDAIWEEPSYLHGSIAWRIRLNGWRGASTADALGWHDRAEMHFSEYAQAQYLEPSSGLSVPDPGTNLTRQQPKEGNAIYTEGYISRTPGKISKPHHYDMNLIFIDQLLRHFNHTSDTFYVRQLWPTIKRHLAWEKRCFDGNNDGLYDAYCCIWASDALQYSGGGVTHSSAYNYFANKTTARLAKIIGEDPLPYQSEADRILNAMNRQLWMPDKGWFAESKDLLGLQKIHPAAALWSIYQVIDSDVSDLFQAWQCLRYIDTEIPHIPINITGISGDYYTMSTTKWMPYSWSINNVASGEIFHTALVYWQTGRNDEAFRIAKSSLLDYMYLGSSPGNFGQLSFYDAYRGELYRDFADGIGIASRALIEGLFGIRPDACNGKLLINPGFPSDWKFASIKIPDISIDFKSEDNIDSYSVETRLFKDLKLVLNVKARLDHVKTVAVNGQSVEWKIVSGTIGQPEIELTCVPSEKQEIKIEWMGKRPETKILPVCYAKNEKFEITTHYAIISGLYDPQQIFQNPKTNPHSLQATVTGETGNRTAFIKIHQGEMTWWMPLEFEVREAIEIISEKNQPSGMLSVKVRNNASSTFKGTVKVNGFVRTLKIGKYSESSEITVPEKYLTVGSNQVEVISKKSGSSKIITNWNITKKAVAKYETIDLSKQFNDQVPSIFKNKYLSPRSPYPTLALPTQGIGDWCSFSRTAEIDDSGLRSQAGVSNQITLPQGIPFATPGAPNVSNILFTSQWDNYPHEASVPLSGKASHVYLLMAGSTNHMQSRFQNGEVVIEYSDGTSDKLVLCNPETWWPIEQDYYDNGFAFNTGVDQPIRVHLKTGEVRTTPYQVLNKNKSNKIDGGAATVLDYPLHPKKELRRLHLKTIANDVVIGLMALTLER
ncbi:MAG: DUF4450 domain-containing protein [Ignavibacteriae bacterium]|nr:MAG: DUF4450 domain-containing protein [Ignavibacteriota bacterium]